MASALQLAARTMSAVPPNIVGPLLQSHLVARHASSIRENENAQRTNAGRQQTSASAEQDTTVETTDNDTQVHTDAEGGGSQGRAFSQPEETPDDQLTKAPDPEGDAGHNIDFEA